MIGISSGVAVSVTYNGITLFKCDRESNSCWIWISPLWLCSYCNVSPTQNVVWSYTRYSSQCCIGAIAIPSTSSWTTTKQQCWTNKNVEYQWENGFIVWDYSPLWLCRTDSNPSIAASTSIANIETIFSKSSYIKSAPICIGCASSCLRDRKNIVNNVKSYRESNCISTSSPLWLTPNYNPVNIIRLGYIRSIWLICTSCNSSIRCRTSRAAPFARSRCNCKEHVCKWYW